MNHKVPTAARYLCLLSICLLLLAAMAGPALAAPRDHGSKVVRVGYYHEKNFSEGHNENDIKRGYAYEYYQLLSRYTGWRYEYIYGTYEELYQKLLRGELDLLAGLGYLEEREELLSYPDLPMGSEYYNLVRRAEDGRLTNDLSTLQGMTVGIVPGAITKTTEEFIAANQLQVKLLTFDTLQERDFALQSGMVDAIVAEDSMGDYTGLTAFARMTPTDYYLGVNKQRPDLLEELNTAQDILQYDQANVLVLLRDKYLRRTAYRASLSEPEREWIAEHGMLIVGYVDNSLPLSGTDENGNTVGLVNSYIDRMLQELRLTHSLPVSYRAFSSSQKLFAALTAHQIDVAFPTDTDVWLAEQTKMYPSEKIFTVPLNILFKKGARPQKVKTVAIRSASKYQQALAHLYYPEAEQLVYETVAECTDAVLQGQADITIMHISAGFSNTHHDKGLQSILIDTRPFGFAVASGNTRLLALLNRGIGLVEPDYAQSLLQQYDYQQPLTITDIIQDHALLVHGIIGLIALLCLIIALIYVRASRHDREMATRLERALQEAQSASLAKTSFLFSMSHDIRTPMNAILGFNELLRQHIDQRERALDYIKKIHISGNYLLTLINNVLDVARIESGKMTVSSGAYNIRDLYEELATVFEAQLLAKRLQVISHWEITHPMVIGDGLKVRQIMLNLAGNAVKYTPEGGKIDITLQELPDPREGWCRLRTVIADSGIGMSEDFLPHLFEEFSRERTTTESKVIGTGLGMPIVKKLVELLDGTIEVESKLGQGTTFTITLPHQIALEPQLQADAYAQTEPQEKILTGKRILLAEDNELNAEIAMELLTSEGFKVEHAEDGAVCVHMLEEAEPGYYDLILMDVQMPNMDGYQATAAIRALPDKSKAAIPIAAMTANAFEEDKRKATEMGMNAHIAKPIDVEEMLQTIGKLL